MSKTAHRSSRRKKEALGGAAMTAAASIGAVFLGSPEADAQSPTPTWFMEDINAYASYPIEANAVVIEGLSMIGPGRCSSAPYDINDVVRKAVSFIDQQNSQSQVIVEVTPQASCDSSTSDYVSAIYSVESQIINDVGQALAGRYFAGVMIDEEPGYGFSASALYGLNEVVHTNSNFNGKYYGEFTEVGYCQGCWSQSDYDSITTGYPNQPRDYVPSPQIYNQPMADEQNTSLADGSSGWTLVTCYPTPYAGQPGYPATGFGNCSWPPADVNGQPWTYSTWGGGNWYNKFQPA